MEEAELRSYIVGLYIGITLHSPIILETDCAFVAAIFANEFDDGLALHDLKKEAWSISKLMDSFRVSKIRCSANEVAHLIACWKYALEAMINKLLLYFLVHDNRLLSMLQLY